MSFFGFDTTLDHALLNQGPGGSGGAGGGSLGSLQDEELEVYTFGEAGYDGLAAQLDEGLDELNDETFGDSAPLAKDFDYVGNTMGADLPPRAAPVNNMGSSGMPPVQRSGQLPPAAKAPEKPVDSVWANIPRAGTTAAAGRTPVPQHPPANNFASPQPSHSHAASRVLTLEEVEAEQRAAAQMARLSLAGAAQASPRPPAAVPSGMPEPARYAPSPLLPQAIPTSTDLEILRIAQQQNQQQQARQLFAQQHQQRQQDIFDQQQRQMQLEQQQQQQQFPSPMLAQQQQQQPPLRGGTPVDMQRFLQHHRSQSSLSQQGQQQPAHLAPAQPPRFAAQQFPPQSRPQQPHLQRQPDVGQIVPNENLTRMQIMESLTAGLPSHQQSQLPPLPPHAGDLMTELEGFAHTLPPEQRDALMAQAMHKIVEAERMEERNRRRQAKIRRISRYNELMTQSDKDFITRIQVSQLVTQDPYTEDFYAQVFGAINQTRMDNHNPRAPTNPNNVLSFGDGGGIGVLKVGERRSGRRENALNRMQNQIERIVSNAKKREALNQNQVNLQGALGKISGRSYKAAPRQALQVGSSLETREDTAAAAAKEGLEALAGVSGANQSPQKPLSKIQALMTIEAMYDAILDIEQLKRDQPPPNAEEAAQIAWLEKYNALVDKVWLESKIMVPVEVTPHPFISLLEPAKGKRLLPRFVSHLDGKRAQLFFTLFVVCYKQLDVVRMSPILDYPDTTPDKLEVEKQTDLFGNTVIQACEGVVRKAELRFVSGILGLLLDAGDVPVLANTLPGILLLTLLLNRATELKSMAVAGEIAVDPQELEQWQIMVEHLGHSLFGRLTSLFPSSRLAAHLAPGISPSFHLPLPQLAILEMNDSPTWQFLAIFAINATSEQQQVLVTELREKILENVASVQKAWITDEQLQIARMRNVNIFLNALGLDSSQITL